MNANTPPEDPGFSYTLHADGHLATLRGIEVPRGAIFSPGLEEMPPVSREVSQRAMQLTAGIFEFAARANEPEPTE